MEDKKLEKKFVEKMLESADKKDEIKPYNSTDVDIDEVKKLTEVIKKKGTLKK
jgi:hypothetical protein